MRWLLSLLLLIAAPAIAAGPTQLQAGGNINPLLTQSMTGLTGQGFDCRGAASCLSWNGSALVESTGLSWTQNGTVPQVTANTLPTTASTGAAGPFSDANYYSNGTGADALDSTGDRFGCVAFVPTGSYPGFQYILSNGVTGTAGYYVGLNATTGSFAFGTATPTAMTVAAGSPVVGLNVGCWWRTGTSIRGKLNLGTTSTNGSAGTEVAGTAIPLRLGRANTSSASFPGKILQVMQGVGACPVPPAPFAATCEGWATYQMKRQFGLLGTRGEESLITRATTKTYVADNSKITGPLMTPDANTVSQVYFNGRNLVDAKNNTWTQLGTVPQVLAANGPPSAGPYSATNYYSSQSTNLMEWTGDWSVTMLYKPITAPTSSLLTKANSAYTMGWALSTSAGGAATLTYHDGSSRSVSTANTLVEGAPNVITIGKSGGTCYVKLGVGTTASISCGTMTVASANPVYIGRRVDGNANANGFVYEVLASTTPFSDALHTARYNEVMGKAFLPQSIATAPAGTATVEAAGTSVSKATTNQQIQNRDVTAWAQSGTCAATADQGTGNYTDLDLINCTNNGSHTASRDNAYSTNSQGPAVFSATFAPDSGSKVGTVVLSFNGSSATGCTCGRDDGGSCTAASNGGATCYAYGTFSAPGRMWVSGSSTGEPTLWVAGVHDGQFLVSSGTLILAGRGQLEAGTYPTPEIVTAGTAVARNGDQIVMPAPFRIGDTQWSVSGEYTPKDRPGSDPEGTVHTLWAAGTLDAANSARLEVVGPKLVFTVVDQYATASTVDYKASNLVGTNLIRSAVVNGRMALYVNGTLVAMGKAPTPGSWFQPTPALWSSPPTQITVGARVNATNQFDGNIKNMKLERDRVGARDVALADSRVVSSLQSVAGTLDTSGALMTWDASKWNQIRWPDDHSYVFNVTSSGTTTAPNGGTAYKIIENTAASTQHWVRKDVNVVSGKYYTLSAFVKPAGRIGVTQFGSGTFSGSARFNISTCAVVAHSAHGSGAAPYPNGWCRIYTVMKPSSTAAVVIYPTQLVLDDISTATYTGDGVSGVYLWGQQFVEGTEPLPYEPSPGMVAGGVGDTLAMVGTVPTTTSNLFPAGSGAGRRGVGGFSDSNYFVGAAAADPLDTTGDRWGCIAFDGYDVSTKTLFGNGLFSADGYSLGISGSGNFSFHRYRPGANVNTLTTNGAFPGLNVACWWSTGNNLYSRMNYGDTATVAAAGAEISASGRVPYLGRYDQTTFSYPGKIYEIVQGLGACPGTTCEVFANKQITAALSNGDPTKPLFSSTGATMHLKGNDYTGGALWGNHLMSMNKVGTVGYSDEFVQSVAGSLSARGYGPFSDANYFTWGTNSDNLDSTGDRWGCLVYNPTSLGTNQYLIYNGLAGVSGNAVLLGTTGAITAVTNIPTQTTVSTANLSTTQAANVACWWRTGTSLSVKLNLGTTATNATAGTEGAGTAYALRIGNYTVGGLPFSGSIYQIVQGLGACPAPPSPFANTCEGWATYQQSRVFGHLTKQSQSVTVVRTTPQSMQVGTSLYQTPAGVLSQDPPGTGHFKQTINYALQSGTMTTGTAVTAPWSSAGTVATGPDLAPDGVSQWSKVTSTAATQTINQTPTTASSTTFTGSVWARQDTDLGYVSVWVGCGAGTPTICTCTRSGSGTCSASTRATNFCVNEISDLGVVPERLSVSVTCSGAITTPYFALAPDQHSVATGTAWFWGAQLETGTYPTPYIPTAGTTVQRNSTTATVPMPSIAYGNHALQSADLSSATWLNYASTDSAVADQGDGFVWREVTKNLVNGSLYQTPTIPGTQTRTASAFARMPSGVGTAGVMMSCQSGTVSNCTCARSDGGACTPTVTSAYQCSAIVNNLSTTPVEISATGTCATALVTSAIALFPGNTTDSSGTAWFSRPQLSLTSSKQAYVPSSATVGYANQQWCASVTYKPGFNWNDGVASYILSNYVGSTANAINLYKSAAYVYFNVYDEAGGIKTVNWAHGKTDKSAVRLTGCNNNGTVTLCADGVSVGTISGAGSGKQTGVLSPMYLGQQVAKNPADGWLSDYKICNNVTSCGQCP